MKKVCLISILFVFTTIVNAQTTYSDIANVLYNNCTTCHRPGGGAPFSMLTYTSIAPWANAMQTALQTGDMPPWSADTSYMHFFNERPISQADRDTILSWITDGALEGDPNLLPSPPIYPQYLLNGIPDLILTMNPFNSNASTNDAYNTFVLPTGLTQNRFIRAIEIIPTAPNLTHHIIVMADTAGDVSVDTSGTAYTIQGDIGIGTYTPGSNPVVFPNSPQLKMGIEIPANGDIILQIHTPRGTLGQSISLQIRLYLYPPNETGIRPVFNFVPLQYWENDFFLLAEETKTFTAEEPTFPFDISIYSAFPHSHQICTEIINYAYDSLNNDTIDLIKINKWDFEHQEYYYFNDLKKIPVGYKYHGEHKYENTTNNPHNPFSPPQLIVGGVATTDEMFFDSFQFIAYQTGDENINLDSILANDPLLNYPTGINDNTILLSNSYVAPNPITDKAAIYFNYPHNNWSKYALKVWTLDGRLIQLPYHISNGSIKIKKGNLTPNIYIYEILDATKKLSTGKLIVQ